MHAADTPYSTLYTAAGRANPRISTAYATGGIRSACKSGSRWHRFAFNRDDEIATIEIAASGAVGGGYSMTINGELRSLVPSICGEPSCGERAVTGAGSYTICHVEERVGGTVAVRQGGGASSNQCRNPTHKILNPAITLPHTEPRRTHVLGGVGGEAVGASLVALPHVHNVSLLDGELHCTPRLAANPTALLRTAAGEYYRHDPRLALVHNTLDQPANASDFSGEQATPPTSLPRVAKNSLNRDTCTPTPLGIESSAAAIGYDRGTPFALNASMMRRINSAVATGGLVSSHRRVFAVDGLRLEAPYDVSPCGLGVVSRWRRDVSDACASPVAPSVATRELIASALSRSLAAFGSGDGESESSAHVLDILLDGACSDGAVGARVTVGGECWEHTHPHTLNVYEFNEWPADDDPTGLLPAAWSQAAMADTAVLSYPSGLSMTLWQHGARFLPFLGTLDDIVELPYLPASIRWPEVAALVGAISIAEDPAYEACGSPGEVANVPDAQNLYNLFVTGDGDPPDGEPADIPTIPNNYVKVGSRDYPRFVDALNEHRTRGIHNDLRQGKNMVWTAVALFGDDQLRQRVAWALAQIFVISDTSMKWNEIETWHVYYDIFVRHAFGSFGDVLTEVAYSPMMAHYLTFLDSKSLSFDGSWPDENFAREVMQLFTIGLWTLRSDGTRHLHPTTHTPIMTYTNDDIVTLSRAWTGFALQPQRGNVENRDGGADGGRNYVDPMRLMPNWRDPFPKMGLLGANGLDEHSASGSGYGGYIGDGYPLCVDAPSRAFLRRNATYEYVGGAPSYHMWMSYDFEHLELDHTSSHLHRALCDPDYAATGPAGDGSGGAAFNGHCVLRSVVTLGSDLPCSGLECDADAPRLVKVYVTPNRSAFYEWARPACVELPFYPNAKLVTLTRAGNREQCADPRTPVAGSCCVLTPPTTSVTARCRYMRERMTYDSAVARCTAASDQICPDARANVQTACDYKGYWIRQWRSEPCTLQAQVDTSGWVRIVHNPAGATNSRYGGRRPSFAPDNENAFRVAWDDRRHPDPDDNCSGALECTRRASVGGGGATCLCNVEVETIRVFDAPPSGAADVLARCHIGSLCPDAYDAGIYELLDASSEVETYGRVGDGTGYNEHAILRVLSTGACYANAQSHVVIRGGSAGDGWRFRNPPHFVNFLLPTSVDAAHETNAVLQHYLHHPNTAPFIAHRLIQRFVTSNPSPRYVRVVSDAFVSGTHDGITFTGRYGDLGATIAAVFLDREARSLTLDSDPHHGVLREPLLKLHHLLRAMEFVPKDDRQVKPPSPHACNEVRCPTRAVRSHQA